MRFPEEQKVLATLLDEWYGGIDEFTADCNGVFSEKAKQYDRESPVWHSRVKWPHGFVQELRKKTDRIDQLLSKFDAASPALSVNWDEVNEELGDIFNYARMFASLTEMVRARHEGR